MKLFTTEDTKTELPAEITEPRPLVEVQVAPLPTGNLGAIITNPTARKIAYAAYVVGALAISNTAMAFSSLQAQYPPWLLVSISVIGNLAVPFGALAIANARTPTPTVSL